MNLCNYCTFKSKHTNLPVSAIILFSEQVMGFDMANISVDNGVVTELTTSDSITFNVTIIPTREGKVTLYY